MEPMATLQDLIKHIVAEVIDAGGTLGTTRLVKLLYVIDVEYYRRHRKLLTGLDWIFYHYGPYSLEIPEIIRSLDLDIPQDDVSIGDGRIMHQFKPGFRQKVDISELMPASDLMLVEKVIDRWAIEDLNKLLSYVYFDTEPMQSAKLGEPLDFSKIPKLKIRPSFREYELKLTSEELAQFRTKLMEHKRKRAEMMQLAERQYHEIHGFVDSVYEKAVEQSQMTERSSIPIGMKVTATSLPSRPSLMEDEDGGTHPSLL
jgi:hypothetical protein